MRYSIVVGFLSLTMFCSCNLTFDPIRDSYYAEQFLNQELYVSESFSEITDIQVLPAWLNIFIEYRASSDVYSPKALMTQGYGDCDGYALLWMNIAYVCFGIKADLILVDSKYARAIVDGGEIDHAMIRLNGTIIDPRSGTAYPDFPIGYVYTFDEVFPHAKEELEAYNRNVKDGLL